MWTRARSRRSHAGDSYIEDVSSEQLKAVGERIHATTRYARLAKADAVLICVPTPLTRNREPDLGPLIDSTRALAEVLQSDQLVVLESTTYPGTTRERVSRRCSRSPVWRPAGTSIWRSRPSGSIRGAPTSRCATRRRSWAG